MKKTIKQQVLEEIKEKNREIQLESVSPNNFVFNKISKAIDLTLAKVEEMIDFMDVELFLTDVVDKKTGKKVEMPKEVQELWDIYWEHIKKELLKKIKGDET